jgi:putative transposase
VDKGIEKHVRLDADTGELLAADNDFAAMADELVAAARGQGIEVTGPNGVTSRGVV